MRNHTSTPSKRYWYEWHAFPNQFVFFAIVTHIVLIMVYFVFIIPFPSNFELLSMHKIRVRIELWLKCKHVVLWINLRCFASLSFPIFANKYRKHGFMYGCEGSEQRYQQLVQQQNLKKNNVRMLLLLLSFMNNGHLFIWWYWYLLISSRRCCLVSSA